jgi:hypothetical protein
VYAGPMCNSMIRIIGSDIIMGLMGMLLCYIASVC